MKLPEFELQRYFARHEFGIPYLLSSSDMEALLMGELLALADDARFARAYVSARLYVDWRLCA